MQKAPQQHTQPRRVCFPAGLPIKGIAFTTYSTGKNIPVQYSFTVLNEARMSISNPRRGTISSYGVDEERTSSSETADRLHERLFLSFEQKEEFDHSPESYCSTL
jgi:hypothetical protein